MCFNRVAEIDGDSRDVVCEMISTEETLVLNAAQASNNLN